MNISSVIEYLNKEFGYNLNSAYYGHIAEWDSWWRGYHEPFHKFREQAGDIVLDREMFTLKMAKKVCEDWASILLNEKTQVVIGDNTSSVFVQGDDGTGGVFAANSFWESGNELVEKVFSSGTGAFVLRLDGMHVVKDAVVRDAATKINIEYIPALNIIPLTVRGGKIVDVAFVSEVTEKGKKYIYIETHMLTEGKYQITNSYFSEEEGSLKKEALPAGIAESFNTGADIPLFSILRPNITNNIDASLGLGVSVFANAIDNLKGVDLAYNNFCRDYKLGGKKVFVDKSLTRIDANGKIITPDDVAQQLFVQVGEEHYSEGTQKELIHEYNPSLRIAENISGVQAQLDYLSFKCGLGTKHYQFNAGSVVTATQYQGDKQDLVQNAAKHYIVVEAAIKQLVRGILWAGREIMGQPVNPDAQVTVNFEDSYIIDKESERLRDLQEIRDGLMQKWEYRVKWRGEDETKAKEMTGYQEPNADPSNQALEAGGAEEDQEDE